MKESIEQFIDSIKQNTNYIIEIGTNCGVYKETQNIINALANGITDIECKASQINNYND